MHLVILIGGRHLILEVDVANMNALTEPSPSLALSDGLFREFFAYEQK